MGRALLTTLLCAGCYSPSFREGGACDTACPGDLVCIANVCRSPGYVADAATSDGMADALMVDADGDSDSDGVLDSADNCAGKANVDQHDEDSDQLGDVCDPCPHLSGTAVDGDGDGVGDDCDPQPAVAKQQILFFDPFTSDRTEWTHDTGATRVGETLRVLGAGSGYTELDLPTGELRIAAGGTIASVTGSGSTSHQLSIAFGLTNNDSDFHYCEFYDEGVGTGHINIESASGSSYVDLDSRTYSTILPTGAWSMRIDESASTQKLGLLATLGGVTYTQMSATATTPALVATNRITMYTDNVDARVDYVIVIKTLP